MKTANGKRVLILLTCFVLLVIGVLPATASGAQPSQAASLSFDKDGKFTIMQVSDVQEYGRVNKDTLRIMEAALDQVKPDLVVFTGDQVEGYATYFKYGEKERKVKVTINTILAPLEERGIPFAVVFGNHDQEAGVSKEEQMEFYRLHQGCLAVDEGPDVYGCGTYNLPVMSRDGTKTAFNLYFVDSNSGVPGGGYDNVHEDQIALCKQISDRLKAENGGAPVPSLLFQHIPVEELYNVLKEVPQGTEGAKKWYRELKPGSFMINENNRAGKDADQFFHREPIASPNVNSGQFDAWLEQGDIIGAYFGHDHINHFTGNYKGIDLGYGLSTSYNAYGAGLDGGVQVFEVEEENPADYITYGLSYRTLCGEKMLDPIASFCSTKLSFPATELLFYACVIVPACAIIITVAILAVKRRKRKKQATTASQRENVVTK